MASELSGEGGHFSVFPPPLVSPFPCLPPPSCPAPHVKRNIKGGVRLEGKVNGEGLKGSPLRVPGRPVHPRSSSLPEARPRRQERPAPSAEKEEKEEPRRAERQVPFFLPGVLNTKLTVQKEIALASSAPRYPTQCTSRLSPPPPRPRPLQTLVLGRWRTRQCSPEGAAVVAAPLLSVQQVPALVVVPHLPRIFRLRRCSSRHLLQHLLRRDHSLRLHKA